MQESFLLEKIDLKKFSFLKSKINLYVPPYVKRGNIYERENYEKKKTQKKQRKTCKKQRKYNRKYKHWIIEDQQTVQF